MEDGQDEDEWLPPLHYAASKGELEELRRLVDEEGEDVNTLDELYGKSPLIYASMEGHVETVRFLLDRGADFNLRDGGDHRMTAFGGACYYGRVEVARLLLDRGADPAITDSSGQTVLMDAVCSSCGDVEEYVALNIMRLLLKHGRVDVNVRDELGKTALFLACYYGQVELARVLLLEGGADHNIADHEGLTPMDIAMDIAQEEGREGCVELMKWFEGELERYYCLAKAWHVNDDREAIRQAPTKAEASTAEEAQRAREEAAREYVRGRVERGEALPTVEVMVEAHNDDNGGGSDKKRARQEGEEEVVRAVLQYVLMGMKEDPFIMLMELMRYR